MKQTPRLLLQAVLIGGSVLVIDRLVKQWCVDVLMPIGTIPFWKDVLHFTYAENTGAAFSMLAGQRKLLTVLPVAALFLLLFLYLRRVYAHPLTDLAFPLIMGGAIGNLIDRVQYGYVVDFLEIRLFKFAIFNIADCAISVGAALLVLYLLLNWRELDDTQNKADPKPGLEEDAEAPSAEEAV
ncbi:MAG: signal peptidase II [Clostridia bacterium]|nr:signal peptidase II [Clostridia bacterium]